MGFFKTTPGFGKGVQTVQTQNEVVDQLWGQLEILRHLGKPKGLNAAKAMVPWLNQAEYYYLDAHRSRWRSSGLLYYYSFLNLAKAYLVGKRHFTVSEMKSTSIYHGLHADAQNPKKFLDFEVKIMPPVSSGKNNIFSAFYEKATGRKWPFTSQILVKLSDLTSYSLSITSELLSLYGIQTAGVLAQGMLRTDQSGTITWYEICVHNSQAQMFSQEFQNNQFTSVAGSTLNVVDRSDWFGAYQKTNYIINQCTFFQSQKLVFTSSNQQQVSTRIMIDVTKYLQHFILPYPERREDGSWLFFPKVVFVGQKLNWVPVLTDYIVAFALSTILRYHPHLLDDVSQDSYLAKAWCKQSSVDAMRYFVMLFTDPMIVVN